LLVSHKFSDIVVSFQIAFAARRSEAQTLYYRKVCRSVPRLTQFTYPSPNFCKGGAKFLLDFRPQFGLRRPDFETKQ